MNKILTIIIPTYNMEEYLCRCLDSLIIEEEGMKLLEVLVINDGSKDSSSQIAHEYQDKFPDTFRVIDKENGNYGSCINRGLKEATGKYIKILDADDWFDKENFNEIVGLLKTIDADIVVSPYSVINKKKTPVVTRLKLPARRVYLIEPMFNAFYGLQMHSVMYRTSILRDLGYKQTEGISYTDQEWVFLPMSKVKTFYYYDKVLYKYFLGRDGQTMNPEIFKKYAMHNIDGLKNMIYSYQDIKGVSKTHDAYLQDRLLIRMKTIYKLYLIKSNYMDISELKDLDSFIMAHNLKLWNETVNFRFAGFHYVTMWRKCGESHPTITPFMEFVWQYESLFKQIIRQLITCIV